jgi:16S rRNA (uracil1498-N3)-methyltransferase
VAQPTTKRAVHLLFAPIKKHRQDWLIEKAVELGVTDFHPVLTQNTEVRKLNESRLTQQILEAAEQCERFDIPQLHELKKLDKVISSWSGALPLFACIERFDTKPLQAVVPPQRENVALLIGPEGGFTETEKDAIAKHATAVGLGDTILRCETAVVKALVLLNA